MSTIHMEDRGCHKSTINRRCLWSNPFMVITGGRPALVFTRELSILPWLYHSNDQKGWTLSLHLILTWVPIQPYWIISIIYDYRILLAAMKPWNCDSFSWPIRPPNSCHHQPLWNSIEKHENISSPSPLPPNPGTIGNHRGHLLVPVRVLRIDRFALSKRVQGLADHIMAC